MKKIIIKSFPYIAIFILINVLAYKNSGFYKQQRIYTDRIETVFNTNPNVFFLGDSHSESIKHLNLSKNIGNLAFGADGIQEMYIKTLIIEKYFSNTQYVFIPTEPQIFNNSMSSNSTFLNNYLLKLNDSINVYNKTTLNLITEKVPFFNDNFIKFFLNDIYSKIRGKKNKQNSLWSKLSTSEQEDKATSSGKIDHIGIISNSRNLYIYSEIIRILKLNNIKIIGIQFPVNKHYLNQCKKKDIIKVKQFINEFKLDYNLDYSFIMNKAEYFENEDHLNKTGMEVLSKIILEDTGIQLIDNNLKSSNK